MVKTLDLSHDEIADAAGALREKAEADERRADQCDAAGEHRLADTFRAQAARERALADLLED